MTLTFDGTRENDKRRFEYLYRGLVLFGHMVQQKGLAVLRLEDAVLSKLEAISADCDCGKLVAGTSEPDRQLAAGASSLTLTAEEADLLHRYIAGVPWATGTSARQALKVLDELQPPTDEAQ